METRPIHIQSHLLKLHIPLDSNRTITYERVANLGEIIVLRLLSPKLYIDWYTIVNLTAIILSQFHHFLIPVSSFFDRVSWKTVKIGFSIAFSKTRSDFQKSNHYIVISNSEKVTIFPVSFRETGKSLPQIWPCFLKFSALFGIFETRADIFDRLKTRSGPNFVIFEWNWSDLQNILTGILKNTLFFV